MYASCPYWRCTLECVHEREREEEQERERDTSSEREREKRTEGKRGRGRDWLDSGDEIARGERGTGVKRKGGGRSGMKYPLINTPNCTDPSLQPHRHQGCTYRVPGILVFNAERVRLIFGRTENYAQRERGRERLNRLKKHARKRNICIF